ncbi:Hypothetical protein NocV09_00101690 [Nannochloropsis oceanica]
MEDSNRTSHSAHTPATRDNHMHFSRMDRGLLADKDGALETHVHLRRTGSVDIFAGQPSPSSHHRQQQQQEDTDSCRAHANTASTTTDLVGTTSSGTTRFTAPSPPPSAFSILPPAYPPSSHPPHQTPTVSKSSTAVLSALRALQDKIKRLEKERADAIWEVGMLRQQLEGVQRRAEVERREDVLELQEQYSHVQGAYERLLSDKEAMESKLVRSEERRAVLVQEAGRLRGQLLAEEESRRLAKVRVRGMGARISKMEHAVQNRGVKAENTIAELRETLEIETARRLELEERNEKFGEVLLSVLDMNQEIARYYPAHGTKSQGTATATTSSSCCDYAAAPRTAPKPRSIRTSSSNSGGTLPFLPASHHRTYNLLATLSQAVRECKQREPKRVLDALYELVQLETGSVMGREERCAFPPSGQSAGSASTSFPSTTRACGGHASLARGRRPTVAAECMEGKQRLQQQQQQHDAEEHDKEVILAMQAELKELEYVLEDELRVLNRKYAGMVELARSGSRRTAGSGGGRKGGGGGGGGGEGGGGGGGGGGRGRRRRRRGVSGGGLAGID